jgi:SecD/SecF fusion protein
MGNRKWMFLASGIVLTVAVFSLVFKGLPLGYEFTGGTKITLSATQGVSLAQAREAVAKAGIVDPTVQTIGSGFEIRSTEPSATVAGQQASAVATALGVTASETKVSTIGPEWGANITNQAMLALAVSILAILLYVSIRFEYKMAVTGVIALVHDALITLGIYALLGKEMTPNTVAALLTILGYSLYDTIVVFHRIRENTQNLTKKSFMNMANDSLNQVLARWINTGLSSLIPVVCLLLLGHDVLQAFAFALTIGLLSGAYSSVAVAAPLYAMWKEREPRFQALAKKYADR